MDTNRDMVVDMSNENTGDAQEWLEMFIREHRGVAGTVHKVPNQEELLVAAVNIPEEVKKAIQKLPKGKRMAGSTLETGTDIDWKDFHNDTSGRVKPGAQLVEGKEGVTLLVKITTERHEQ